MKPNALLLSLVVTLVAACAAPPSKVPMPPELNIESPSADLSQDVKSLSGKWAGRWINSVTQVDHILVVEKIDASSATVIYATGEPSNTYVNISPQWRRVRAGVGPGELEFKLSNGASVSYKLQADGSLAGTYSNKGFNSVAKLTRVQG